MMASSSCNEVFYLQNLKDVRLKVLELFHHNFLDMKLIFIGLFHASQ